MRERPSSTILRPRVFCYPTESYSVHIERHPRDQQKTRHRKTIVVWYKDSQRLVEILFRFERTNLLM